LGSVRTWRRERGLAATHRRLADEMEIRLNFWQGKNVRLRGIEPSDADIFFAWNMDSEMARRLDFVWPPVSQAQVKKEIEELSQKKLEHDSFTWVIEDASGAAVGSISTHNCNARNGTFSYGVGVVREHQRKGYAAEAIQMILKYYFEELRYQKVSVAVSSPLYQEQLSLGIESNSKPQQRKEGKAYAKKNANYECEEGDDCCPDHMVARIGE
jgi:RimJ/RimL family protein N-acetyltransferase